MASYFLGPGQTTQWVTSTKIKWGTALMLSAKSINKAWSDSSK